MKKKVLISGAGPAGLTTALLLDRDKFDVHVVERAPSFVDMGFSIILWQKGYEILQRALDNNKIQGIFPLNTFTIYGGEDVVPLQHSDTTGLGHSIKREDLMQNLSDTFLDKLGSSHIKFATSIKSIDQSDKFARVTFSDGSKDDFDLVIIADGMHSQLRSTDFESVVASKPYKIKYAWIKQGSNLRDEGIIGFMKGYVYLIQTVGEDALLAYYTHAAAKDDALFLQNLKQHFEKERGGIFEIDSETAAIFASEEVEVERPYSGRVVLVGDAYHGHPPTLAMGTSMAFEDAYEIANLLNSSDYEAYESIFKEYTRKRNKSIRETYRTQAFVEVMSMSDHQAKLAITEFILKYGGWKIIEPLLKKTFSG